MDVSNPDRNPRRRRVSAVASATWLDSETIEREKVPTRKGGVHRKMTKSLKSHKPAGAPVSQSDPFFVLWPVLTLAAHNMSPSRPVTERHLPGL